MVKCYLKGSGKMVNLLYDKKTRTEIVLQFENQLGAETKVLKKNDLFSGKSGEVYVELNPKREGVIYFGLGHAKKLDSDELRVAGFKLNKALINHKVKKAHINFKEVKEVEKVLFHFVEGLLHGNYSFNRYKSDVKEVKPVELSLNGVKKHEHVIVEATNLVKGVNIAKDFVNTPAIDLYPENYANQIQELFKDTDVEVEVYDKAQIEKLGMKAFLAVAHGSERDPRFVVMKYMPNKETEEHITFVGKGMTYDSGGYAIKPATSMVTMQNDMGGSAAVVGALKAISDNKLPVNIVAVTALAENMISGRAYKNGDIISSMKGTTIEVINTDAEGRITLADSLYYAATLPHTTKIIELSTLTGACVVAFGKEIVGSVANNDKFYKEVHEAGLRAGELNWRLPITESLTKAVKSDVADLKNSIAGGAGVITAGIFLEHFVENKPFVHLDIAGTAFGNKRLYYSAGASGIGVRTLYELVK